MREVDSMEATPPLPEALTERWYAAIARRHSRRSFQDRPLTPHERDAMAAHCRTFRPFSAVRVALLAEAPESLFAHRRDDRPTMSAVGRAYMGIMGSYGRISDAPAALAFAGELTPGAADAQPDATAQGTDAPDASLRSASRADDSDFAIEELIGYVGETAVLEAAALGLDTCWVAGFFSPGLTESLIGAGTGEVVFAVSPLGHAVEALSGKEKYVFQMGRPKKRLKLEHIALGLSSKDWPHWAVAGIRAVQTAPSATNRQPWRFRLDGDTVVLASNGPDTYGVSKRIDCGIAMLHFELGVRQAGRGGHWEPPGTGERLDVARWRPTAASRLV
jgi:nitroreductase